MHREVRRLPRRRTEARSLRGFFHPFGVGTLSLDWRREREAHAKVCLWLVEGSDPGKCPPAHSVDKLGSLRERPQ
jgi:hypothetical protein